MQTISIGGFKYSLIQHPDDIIRMPLMRNLFGINNRIYANLGSYTMNEDEKSNLKKIFDDEELKYPCLNRLFELHVFVRDEDDEYEKIKSIDFAELFELVNNKSNQNSLVHISYAHGDDKNEIILLPLNSRVLQNGANYAYQEIEKLKMDNMMMSFEPEKLKKFINIFQC
mgnify:CR=1 FL=1